MGVGSILSNPLAARLRACAASDDAADVMAADYLGALAAGVAFPFLLVPAFGLVTTTLAAGLLNLVLAGVVVLAVGTNRRRGLGALALLLALAAVLAVGLARSDG